ncbi:MAG TPA: hypothetical protein VFA33_08300 [Bryobacteraceae bacterium]|nr:hypothetical protein [Bryobacteraceae bacterium]
MYLRSGAAALVWWGLLAVGVRGYAAEADALAISANIQARHLPFGTILDPIFAAPQSNQIVGYTRCGDSAIWTGHYLAAEAFRYAVTRSPDAFANLKSAIAGIQSLVDVTGTDLLARCLVPANSPYAAGIQSEEAHNGIFTNRAAGAIWVGNTSRDEYSGVIFGLAVAYDLVDDPGVKSSVRQLVTRLVDFLTEHGWLVVMPDGSISTVFLIRPDQMLAFAQVGKHVNPDHFAATYDHLRSLSLSVLAPIAVDVASDDSYFKFNLDYINFYNLIRLDDSPGLAYAGAYALLRNHTAPHQNAFFDMIDRALNGPDRSRDSEALALLDQWLQRPRRDPAVDLHGVVAVCGSQACQPVPVPLRPPTDFLWQRSPFQLSSAGSGTIEGAGIDYILPYWMARYYELRPAFVVQPAAAPLGAVAPDSLASIYGSNLAGQPGQAGGLPLPLSLGGVSLTVQDAAGTARSAALLYVSPGQINFLVPHGTAPGLATFTVGGAGGPALYATAMVRNVAPALFTMNGNGSGVAAATAIRTNAGNPRLQASVQVFQCGGGRCAVTPIDVGLDTPVFLSLYGTGIRNRSSLAGVQVTIAGQNVPVLYAGPQPDFPGLDQVNVGLTLGLRGSGTASVVLTVDGQAANTVSIALQ